MWAVDAREGTACGGRLHGQASTPMVAQILASWPDPTRSLGQAKVFGSMASGQGEVVGGAADESRFVRHSFHGRVITTSTGAMTRDGGGFGEGFSILPKGLYGLVVLSATPVAAGLARDLQKPM